MACSAIAFSNTFKTGRAYMGEVLTVFFELFLYIHFVCEIIHSFIDGFQATLCTSGGHASFHNPIK